MRIPFVSKKPESPQSERKQNQDFMEKMQVLSSQLNQPDNFQQVREEKDDLTRWQQDLKEEVNNFIHDLKREFFDDGVWKKHQIFIGKNKEGEFVYMDAPPLMNDMGIYTCLGYLKPLISRNLMMSNFDTQNILRKMRRTFSAITQHLSYNWRAYEIEKRNLPIILQIIKDFAEPTHWRSWNNGERSFQSTINKNIYARTESTTPQKKSIWDRFK